jgi:hypothetical protein
MIGIDTPTPDQFKAFADMMALGLGDRDLPRTMTEAEARAASWMFWMATRLARVTVALWNVRNKRPTKDELFVLTMALRAAEQAAERMMTTPPGDGSALVAMIANLQSHWDDVQDEADRILGPEART